MPMAEYQCPEGLWSDYQSARAEELRRRRGKLLGQLHEVEFELTASPEAYDLATKVWAWLKRQKSWQLTYDAGLWSRCQWDVDRREPYGNGALFTLTTEGPLYDIINAGAGPKVHERFVEFLEGLGIYYELGFAWSLHFYPIQGPGRIWEE